MNSQEDRNKSLKKNDRKLRTDLSWENDNQQGSTFEWLFVIP